MGSRKEMETVEKKMIPPTALTTNEGAYYTDYKAKYAVWKPVHSKEDLIYVTQSAPHQVLPDGLWAPGEPNFKHNDEHCVEGGSWWARWGPNVNDDGLNDSPCSNPAHSIICELP